MSQKGYAKLDAKRDRKILLHVPVHHFIIFTYPNSSANYKNDYLFLTQEVRAESILKLDNMLSGKNTSIDEIDEYMQELMTVYQESVNEVEVDESSLPITSEYFKKVPDCRVNQSKILQEIIDRQQYLIKE